jgi:hypothetical protein
MPPGLEAAAQSGVSGSRATPAPGATPREAERRRRAVRRTALLCALIAAAFYLGFILIMLVRAAK